MYGRRGPPPPPSRGPSYWGHRQERQPLPSSILGTPPPQATHGPPMYLRDGDRARSQQQEIMSSETAGQLLAHALIAEALVGPGQPAPHHPPPSHRHNIPPGVSYDYHSGSDWRHGSSSHRGGGIPPMALGSGSLATKPTPLFQNYDPRPEPLPPPTQGALLSRERPASRSQGIISNKVSIFDRPSNTSSHDIAPPSRTDIAAAFHDFVSDTRSERGGRSLAHNVSSTSRAPDRERGYSESYHERTSSRVAGKRRDVPPPTYSSKYSQSTSRSGEHRSRKKSDDRRGDRIEDRDRRGDRIEDRDRRGDRIEDRDRRGDRIEDRDRRGDRIEDRDRRGDRIEDRRSPKRRRHTDNTSPSRNHLRPKSREGSSLHTLSDNQERLLEVRKDVSLASRSPVEARLGPPPAVADRLGPAPDTSVQSRLGPIVPLIPELPDLREEIEEKRRFEGHSQSTPISPSTEFLSNSIGSMPAMSSLQSDMGHKIDTSTLPPTSIPSPTSCDSPTRKQPIQSPTSAPSNPASTVPKEPTITPILPTSVNIPPPLISRPSETHPPLIPRPSESHPPLIPRPSESHPPLLSIVPPPSTVFQATHLPFDCSDSDHVSSGSSRLRVVDTSKPDVYIVSDDESALVIDVESLDNKHSASSPSSKEELFIDITKDTPKITTTTTSSPAGLLSTNLPTVMTSSLLSVVTSSPLSVVTSSPLSRLSSVQLRSFTIPALEKMSPTPSHRSSTPSNLLSQDSDSQSSQDQGSLLSSTLRVTQRATNVLGSSLVFLLDVDSPVGSPTILARFFDAVTAIHRLCAVKIGRVRAFNYLVPYFRDVFKGFVTGTLKERSLKPTLLYERELTHLLTICKNDVEKWKQQLNAYNLIAEALPHGKANVESFLIRHNLIPKSRSPKKNMSLSSAKTTTEGGSKTKPVNVSKTHHESGDISRESVLTSSDSEKSSSLPQTNKTDETAHKDSSLTTGSSKLISSSSNKPTLVPNKQSSLPKPSHVSSEVSCTQSQTLSSSAGKTDKSLKQNVAKQTPTKLPSGEKQSPSSVAANKISSSSSTQDKTTTSKAGASLRKRQVDHATTRAERLAKDVLTRQFVSELSQVQESSLFKELFVSTVKIYGCMKWKRRNTFCWEYFIPYFKKVYPGFAVGDLTDTTVPSTPTVLFRQELRHLHKTCGTDLKKWQQRIHQYVSTTSTLPKSKQELPKFLHDNQHFVEHSHKLFIPSHSLDSPPSLLAKDTEVQVTMFVPLSSESQKHQPTPDKQPNVMMKSPTPTQHTCSSSPSIRSPLPTAKLNIHQQSAFRIVSSNVKPTQETCPSIAPQQDTTGERNEPLISKTIVSPPLKPDAPSQQSESRSVLSQSGSRTPSQLSKSESYTQCSEAINTGAPSQRSEAINTGAPCGEKEPPPPGSESDGSTRSTPVEFMVIDSYDSQETLSDDTHSKSERSGSKKEEHCTLNSSSLHDAPSTTADSAIGVIDLTISSGDLSSSLPLTGTEGKSDVGLREVPPSSLEVRHEEIGSLSPGEIVSPSPSSQDNASLSPGEIVSSSPSPPPTLAQQVAAKNLSSESTRLDSEPPLSHFHYMYHSHPSYMLQSSRPRSPPPSRYRSSYRYRRSRSRDRRSRSRDRRSRSRDRRSRSHDRRSRSRDRRSRSHNRRRSRSRDRRSKSRVKRSKSRDRRSRSHDRRSRSHSRRSWSYDRRRSRSHDRQSRSHDKRSTSWDRRSRSQEYRKSRSRSHERRPRKRSPSASSNNSEALELEILELKKKAIMSMIQKEPTSTTPLNPSQEHATPSKCSPVDDVPTSAKSDSLYPLITSADLVSGSGEGGVVDMDICSTSSMDSDQLDKKSSNGIEEMVEVDSGGRPLFEVENQAKERGGLEKEDTLGVESSGQKPLAVKIGVVGSKEKNDEEARVGVSPSLDTSGMVGPQPRHVVSGGQEPRQVSVGRETVKKKESSPSLSVRHLKTSSKLTASTTLSPVLSPSPVPSPPSQRPIPSPNSDHPSSTSQRPIPKPGSKSKELTKNGSQPKKSVPEATRSVKIYPSKKETWDIQPFHIVSSGVDSDTDEECSDEHHNEPISDISKFLLKVRKETEVSVKFVAKDKTSSHQTLAVPSPIAALPPAKRKEYILLQKQLALHKKKKAKIRSHSLPQIQTKPSSLVSGGDKQCLKRSGVEGSRKGKHPRSTVVATHQPPSKKQCIQVTQAEVERADCERTIIKYRHMVEDGQQRLTLLTDQLTETVSEIEELELKMELYTKHMARLKKQLEVTKEQHSKAEEKRQNLQNKVRSIKDTVTQHNQYIQEAELKISANREDDVDGREGVASYRGDLSPLQYENISDSESVHTNSHQHGPLQPIEYESISNVSSPAPIESPQPNEHSSRDNQPSQSSLDPLRPSLNVEPVSDAEDPVSRHPSPVVVELVSDCEQMWSEPGRELPSETGAVSDDERGGDKKHSVRDEPRTVVDDIMEEHSYFTHQSPPSSLVSPVDDLNQATSDHQVYLTSNVPAVKEHCYCLDHSPRYEVEIPVVMISDQHPTILTHLEGGSLKTLELVERSLDTTQTSSVLQCVTQETPMIHHDDTAPEGADESHDKLHATSHDYSSRSHDLPAEDTSKPTITSESAHTLHDTTSKSNDLPKPMLTSEKKSRRKKKTRKSFSCRRTLPYSPSYDSLARKSTTAGSVEDKSRRAVMEETSRKTGPKRVQLELLTEGGLLDRVMHTTLSTTLHSVVSQHNRSIEHPSTSSSVPPSAKVEGILSALVTSLNQTKLRATSVSSSLSPEPPPSETSTPLAELTSSEPDSPFLIANPSLTLAAGLLTTMDESESTMLTEQQELASPGDMSIDPSIIFHPGTNDLFELSSSVPPFFTFLPRQDWARDLPLEMDPRAFEESILDSVRDSVIPSKADNESSSSIQTERHQQQVTSSKVTKEKDKAAALPNKLPTTHHQVSTSSGTQTEAAISKSVKSGKSSLKQTGVITSKVPSLKPSLPGTSSRNISTAKIQVVQDQLQKKILELKGQLAAKATTSTSGRSSPVESSDKISKPHPSQLKTTSSGVKRSTPVLVTGGGQNRAMASSSSSSMVSKTTGAADAMRREICKLLGGDSMRQLDQLMKLSGLREHQTFSGSVMKREEKIDLVSVTFCSVGPLARLDSISGPPPTVSNDIIAAIEQPVKEKSSSLEAPLMDTDHHYSSPLLAFKSYRLNPLYRTHEKLALSSLSHSNKIDPHKIMCKFELFGVCNNPECNAQHLRDLQLSREEVVKDLVSYCPSLVDSSERDVVLTEQNESSELQTKMSEKLTVFSSSLVQRYSSKVPDEDLYKVAVHEVNSEKNKTSKKGYVSFQDEPCSSDQAVNETTDLSLLDTPTGLVPWSVSDTDPSRIQRYFTSDDAVQKRSISSDPVQQCLHAARQSSGEELTALLGAGLEQMPSSEELWVEYIRCKGTRVVLFDEDPSNPHLVELSLKALVATKCSQAVVFESLRRLGTYKEKQRVIVEAMKSLRKRPLSESTSQQCLELMLNSVLLDLITGRNQSAVTRMQLAFSAQSGEDPQHTFTDLTSGLTHQHCLILSLCYINVVYSDQLPHCVLTQEESFPARIVSLDMFTINWDNQRQLPHKDYKKIIKLFRVCLECCGSSVESQGTDQSSPGDIKQRLPLYLNLVLFKATHGDREKALLLLSRITTVSPQLPEAWILYARILRDKEAILKVLMEAIRHCPHSCELYYLAARVELFVTNDGGKKDEERAEMKAIKWLTLCVSKFFKLLPSDPPLLPRDALYLYRKLLGQMVPYDYQTPEYSDDVNLDLMKQNVSLWLCYCLLVELQAPTDQTGEVVMVGSEFQHDSVEEAFESAIHSTLSPEGSRQLWKEYLCYSRAKLTTSGVREFKNFYSLVQRCLAAVDSSQSYLVPLHGQLETCHDFSFHNEVADLFLSVLPSSSPLKMAVLQRFLQLLPANHTLVSRLVKCAVDRAVDETKVELAQSVLANHLLDHPHSSLLWRMAVGLERRLGQTREARWLYRQAIKTLPLHFDLWKDLLVFEVGECLSNEGVPSGGSLVSRVMKGAQHRNIDLSLKTILLLQD